MKDIRERRTAEDLCVERVEKPILGETKTKVVKFWPG